MSLVSVLIYFFSILANLSLGLIVFFRNPKNIINRFFTLITLPMVGWLATLFIINNVFSYRFISVSARLNSAFLILLGYALFYFSYHFPEKTFNLTPLLNFAFTIETFGLIALTLFTLEITGSDLVSGESLTVYGRLYPLFVIHFLVYCGSSLLILLAKRKKFKGFPRAQINCLLLGLSGALLFGMIMHVLLPWLFKVDNFHILRPLSTLFFLGFTSYGMVKFRLLDIRLIAARTVAYFLLICLIGLLMASGLYVFNVVILGDSIARSQIYISVLMVLFILFAFPTLNKIFEKATDKIFLKEGYDTAKLLRKLSLITASTLSLEDLIKGVLDELFARMKISQGSVVLLKDSEVFEIQPIEDKRFFSFSEKELAEISEKSSLENKILILDETIEGKTKEMMRKLHLSIIIPLKVRGKRVGLLLLGEKSSGEIYSVQDIDVFEILGPELAVAAQNAIAYEEIRKFNITLKKEIQKATSELRRANVRLIELDQIKNEFLSIATHELRTPMTAVKGYLDMVISGDAGKINKKTKEFLTEAFNVTDRLAALVNDMLDVSRIEQKRLDLKIKNFDLSVEIKKVCGQLNSLAKEKKLSLTYKSLKSLPLVKADQDKVRQILNNLIGNAIKFTKKGGMVISHKVNKEKVITQIKDTGMGISEENLISLFQKFVRVNGALDREEGGTGLGLYVSKGLVENMSGKIWGKSKLGQGSTFSFSLPRVK
ncbi:GAF domain-containing sensor histidine kinase [Candidatus Microgenomates bacterium]|nr:GAF domain-containing sensor histidine kinase [Candidatus Microgenomates bacterium]